MEQRASVTRWTLQLIGSPPTAAAAAAAANTQRVLYHHGKPVHARYRGIDTDDDRRLRGSSFSSTSEQLPEPGVRR